MSCLEFWNSLKLFYFSAFVLLNTARFVSLSFFFKYKWIKSWKVSMTLEVMPVEASVGIYQQNA